MAVPRGALIQVGGVNPPVRRFVMTWGERNYPGGDRRTRVETVASAVQKVVFL